MKMENKKIETKDRSLIKKILGYSSSVDVVITHDKKLKRYNIEGVSVFGKGIFGNPYNFPTWIPEKNYKSTMKSLQDIKLCICLQN